jgi:dihydroflavonol-4-reductase
MNVPYVTTKRIAEQEVLAASSPDLETVVLNPGCVIGPDDFSGSEFGTMCRRFWHGRIPFYFGGGNNFVDVRDVAAGHWQAAIKGRPGNRYILGGHNRTYTAFFGDLARVARRMIFRLKIPNTLGTLLAALCERYQVRGKTRAYLTLGQARLLSLFFYYDSAKARHELGFQPRPLNCTLADCYAFWMRNRHGTRSPFLGGQACVCHGGQRLPRVSPRSAATSPWGTGNDFVAAPSSWPSPPGAGCDSRFR